MNSRGIISDVASMSLSSNTASWARGWLSIAVEKRTYIVGTGTAENLENAPAPNWRFLLSKKISHLHSIHSFLRPFLNSQDMI